MPEDILVVEYEPRYVERIRQALAGQPFSPHFAKDGEEALRLLDARKSKLIVLSSVIPKVGTGELIRVVRGRADYQDVPILITASGYTGRSPKADAVRMGASDILPKPYSEGDFLTKIQQVLGISTGQTEAFELPRTLPASIPMASAPTPPVGEPTQKVTSRELFGEMVDEASAAAAQAKRAASRRATTGDVDKMLADTLSGVFPKKSEGKPSISPSAESKPKAARPDIDKMLQDSLSGLEKTSRPRTVEMPAPPVRPSTVEMPAPPVRPSTVEMPAPPVRPLPPPVAPLSAPRSIPGQPAAKVPAQAVVPLIAEPEPFPESVDEKDAFGPYVLLEKIATGGMAEVWKARRRGVEGFQKMVAIKKILPHLSDNEDFIEMFVDEAKLAAQLNHNNIIHIYDLGKIGTSYYIAMELIDGHDLKTILKRGEERDLSLPLDISLFIASKIAAALDYAHRKRDFDEKEMGLVHRDVSPQNVLISHEGDIKLCDFGIAKAASKASHTQAGALKGKLQYMSPEQAWGRKIDKRSDIFALGTVLFEMLTGRKLFLGESEMAILDLVRDAKVVAPSTVNDEVSPEIDKIVLKALGKDPGERYQTAGDMARDLDAVLYTFRPAPTSADLAIYMHRLEVSPTVVGRAPVVEDEVTEAGPGLLAATAPTLIDTPLPARLKDEYAAPMSTSSPFAFSMAAPKRKRPIVPIVIAAVVIPAVASFLIMRSSKSSPPASPPAASSTEVPRAPATTPATESIAVVPATATTATIPTATVSIAPPVLDQARIDQEVGKRLEAERARLQTQREARLAATQRQQAEAVTETPTPAPAPVQAQPVPPPTATVAETPPAPPPVQVAAPQPEARRASLGDLVEPGTEGLVLPQLVRLNKPPYPQIARIQKVQGVVIVSVLVSETGRVLDVKVLRGVPQLNDAAVDAVRKSTFTPATKDGVRVRSRATLTIPFRL